MAENDRCPRCGALVLPTERFCAQCGAPLEGGAARAVRTDEAIPLPNNEEIPALAGQVIAVPHTLEELKAYCYQKGMPLEKMRFFLDVDYRQPKAFGIYRDGDQFVVYKNKADGSRAVRYHGPDEAHAVGELYAKLLDECHMRGIYPDQTPEQAKQREKAKKRAMRLMIATVVVFIAMMAVGIWLSAASHRHDGYYRADNAMYYRYGDSWYYDDYYGGWMLVDAFPYDTYDDYYLGDDYDAGWGASDFESSSAWERIQAERESSSHDYDSWDSGSTDWSSDW